MHTTPTAPPVPLSASHPRPACAPRARRPVQRTALRLVLGAVLGSLSAAAVLSGPAWGRATEPPALTLPDSAAGRCAAAYFDMMAAPSPDGAAKFEKTWASQSRLSRATFEERAARSAELREQWGALTPVRVVSSEGGALSVLVRSARAGEMLFEFQFEPGDGSRLDAILISSGEGVGTPRPLTADARASAVAGAAKALRDGYVYPEVAEKMAASIETRLTAGEYDSITTDAALARRLTDDLRAISNDKHLGVGPAPRSGPPSHGMPPPTDMRRENYAFKKVEILPGNVGYLRFDLFMDNEEAMKTGAAAMGFLANCDAIIFDLRSNGGGSPEMIRFLTSYLFEQPTHLNDMVDRNGAVVEEYWTLPEVPGQRLAADLPVYVLTSGRTFSGAEEFSYNLKNLKRATIVGETTGGGAHPVRGQRIDDRFMIRVPYMRANNPISRTNWEGTGVEPDVKTSAGDALEKAQALAREAIEQRAKKQ